MAKSDLLKEAIADAKAVKETALANAKIALEEAFQPRIKSMLETELIGELDDDEMGMEEPMDDMGDEMGMDDMGDEMGDEGGAMDVGDIEIDTDMDGEIDFTGDIMSKPGAGAEMDDMDDMEGDIDLDASDAPEDPDGGDAMGIEEIIAELEADLESEGTHEGMYMAGEEDVVADEEELNAGMKYEMYSADNRGNENYGSGSDNFRVNENSSIDELIEAILAEEEDDDKKKKDEEKEMNAAEKEKEADTSEMGCGSKNEELKRTLGEAYDTVSHLKSVINEVNLLNAKLLYTNKLFRNFDLNEGQKMKVIENFDRAGNTRSKIGIHNFSRIFP